MARKKNNENKPIVHAESKNFLQQMGVTRTVIRPREEVDIQLREDRIGRYFRKYLNRLISSTGGYVVFYCCGRSCLLSNGILLCLRRSLRFRVLSGSANGSTSFGLEALVCIQENESCKIGQFARKLYGDIYI